MSHYIEKEKKIFSEITTIFLLASKYNAREITIKKEQEVTKVDIKIDESSSKRIKSNLSSIDDFSRYLKERSFFWPEIKENAFLEEALEYKSILLTPHKTNLRIQASYKLTPHKIEINNFNLNDTPSIDSELHLTKKNNAILKKIISSNNGIIFTNVNTNNSITGLSILLSLKPDAIYVNNPNELIHDTNILNIAKENLLIVPQSNNDSLQGIINFLNLIKDRKNIIPLILGSFLHYRVKRVCSNCSKPTKTSQVILKEVPEVLRPLSGETYVFGKGCSACNQSSYKGSIGIESLLYMSDNIKELLLNEERNPKIAVQAYKEGSRTLIEDGLLKIKQGFTSYENLNKIVKNIPSIFQNVIKEHKLNKKSELYSNKKENKKKILLVEDNKDQRNILKTLFDVKGFEVLEAEDGIDALQTLKKEEVDLLITDLMMPNIDGAELVKKVRLIPKISTIPILVLTAIDNHETEFKLLDVGADDYCNKSITKKILLKRVENLLSRA